MLLAMISLNSYPIRGLNSYLIKGGVSYLTNPSHGSTAAVASSQHTKVKVVRSTGYKLIAGLVKKRRALVQHVVQDDGDPVTTVKKKHVKQPATETIMDFDG